VADGSGSAVNPGNPWRDRDRRVTGYKVTNLARNDAWNAHRCDVCHQICNRLQGGTRHSHIVNRTGNEVSHRADLFGHHGHSLRRIKPGHHRSKNVSHRADLFGHQGHSLRRIKPGHHRKVAHRITYRRGQTFKKWLDNTGDGFGMRYGRRRRRKRDRRRRKRGRCLWHRRPGDRLNGICET
jgi:hypothetical protein